MESSGFALEGVKTMTAKLMSTTSPLKSMNLKVLVLSAISLGGILLSSSVQAQVISGTLSTPNTAAFGSGVTVTGGVGTLQATPFALPGIVGVPTPIQFTGSNIFQFNNLPATGIASTGSLTSVVNLVVNPGGVAIGPLNFTTVYDYDADAIVSALAGTVVTYTPTGAPTFNFGGSTYQVDLNTVLIGGQGTPTTLSTNTITGSITLLRETSSAPEPGTLVLAGLGIAGLVLRRRKH